MQEDLCEECIDFLSKNISHENIYQILGFAHEKDVSDLKNCCMRFFKKDLDLNNVVELIKYLDRQEDSEFKENNKGLRNIAFNFVLDRFFDIYENEKGSMQIYENFLIVNIELDNLPTLVRFLDWSYRLPEEEEFFLEDFDSDGHFVFNRATPKTKDLFNERTIQLKEAVFSFIHENVKTVMTGRISEGFSKDFFRDFTLHLAEKTSKQIQNLMMKGNHAEVSQEESEEKKNGNGKKRMEPVQNGLNEENSMLKKTKKFDSEY